MTVGACGCPAGQGWSEECKENLCPEYGERGELFPTSRAWRPVFSNDCEAMGELPDHQAQTEYHPDFIASGGPPVPNECKIRPVSFIHDWGTNRVSITWDWLGHPSVLPLAGRDVLNRIAYPPPSEVELINCSGGEIPVCDRLIKSFPDTVPQESRTFTNVVELPVSAGQCFGATFDINVMSPDLLLRIAPQGPLTRPDELWALLGDPAAGDLALLTLDPERLTPRAARHVVLGTPEQGLPALRWAAMTSATLDRGQLGLTPGRGEVLLALGAMDPSGNPTQDLWAGDLAGDLSNWRRVASSPAPQGAWLHRPTLVVDPQANRILVVAERHLLSAGPVSSGDDLPEGGLHHVIHALDIETGVWQLIGALALPPGLRGYSVVHLPWQRRLLLAGGRDGLTYSSAIYSVSLDDLAVAPSSLTLPPPAWREEAAASLAPDARRVILFGGGRDGAQLSDLWTVDLVQETVTLVATEVPGARQGFVATSPDGKHLLVAAGQTGDDPSISLWSVDRDTGEAQPVTLLDLRPVTPGLFEGQIESGVSRVFQVTIPQGLPYPGRLTLAALSAAEPGLRLRVIDRSGEILGEGSREGLDLRVAWLGQPGEPYLLVVGPATDFPLGARVPFQVQVTEGKATLAGQLQGAWEVERVAVSGQVAWLSGPKGVQTVDLDDASSPRLLDRLPVAGQVQGLVLAGEGACVARTAHPHGLKCMDAVNPADLHWGGPAAKTPSMGWGIASLGEVGYLAEGPMGVGIYHLVPPDPPHQPAHLGRIWPGGMVTHTTVHGGRLFAGLASGQVRIYDLGNPTRPELLGSFVATGPVAGMAVHGNLAMVHVVASDGVMECLLGLRCARGPTVEIFDLGDSTAPVKVGEHDTTTTLPWAFVRSQGDRLLVPRALGLDVLMVVPTGETP